MDVAPAFIDETGILRGSLSRNPVYGIGLLVVNDPAGLTDSLYQLHFSFKAERSDKRRQLRRSLIREDRSPSAEELDRLFWSTRHHEYRFSELNPHNLQEYVDLLNLFFTYRDVEFHALLLDRTQPGFNLEPWGFDEWAAYVELTCELMEQSLTRDVFAILDMQEQPKSASFRMEDRICAVPQVAGCLRATSEMSVFLQIVDVLLGCVQFDWRDQQGLYESESRRAVAKRNLTALIKSRTNLEAGEPILSQETGFRRITSPFPFTVRLRK